MTMGCCRYAGLALLCWVAAPASAQQAAEAKEAIAAKIGDVAISLQEVDEKALASDLKLAQALYEARLKALEDIIMERTLGPQAATQGMTVDALIQKVIAEKIKPVTSEDVAAFYNTNQARMRGQTLEQTSERIKGYLDSQAEAAARKEVLDELKQRANVRIALDVPRVDVVVAAGEPFMGPADAQVTIIEYSDFQ